VNKQKLKLSRDNGCKGCCQSFEPHIHINLSCSVNGRLYMQSQPRKKSVGVHLILIVNLNLPKLTTCYTRLVFSYPSLCFSIALLRSVRKKSITINPLTALDKLTRFAVIVIFLRKTSPWYLSIICRSKKKISK